MLSAVLNRLRLSERWSFSLIYFAFLKQGCFLISRCSSDTQNLRHWLTEFNVFLMAVIGTVLALIFTLHCTISICGLIFWHTVSFQLKTPSCQPLSTTPTAPQFTSNSRPLMSCIWPAATSCRRLTGLTCRHLRGRTKSSPSSTRWWAWWRESSRSVTFLFKSLMADPT